MKSTQSRKEAKTQVMSGKLSRDLVAERDRLRTQAQQHGEEAMLIMVADEMVKLRRELKAYRDGGLTEEILRRNDGYIKVGRGCAIVIANNGK